jgi:hypothetical protein
MTGAKPPHTNAIRSLIEISLPPVEATSAALRSRSSAITASEPEDDDRRARYQPFLRLRMSMLFAMPSRVVRLASDSPLRPPILPLRLTAVDRSVRTLTELGKASAYDLVWVTTSGSAAEDPVVDACSGKGWRECAETANRAHATNRGG